MIQFFVNAKPMSTQSGTVVNAGGRRIPLRRNPQFSKACKVEAIKSKNATGWNMLEGPVVMGVTIFMQRPKKLKSKWAMTGADILNIIKGPMDAWQGVVYKDDRQVVECHISKQWAGDGWAPGLLMDFREADETFA